MRWRLLQNVVVKVRVRVFQEDNDNVQHGEVESEFVSRNPYELSDFFYFVTKSLFLDWGSIWHEQIRLCIKFRRYASSSLW